MKKNASDFFKNAKAESIEIIGIVTSSNVVNPVNEYKREKYMLLLEPVCAEDGGALMDLQNEAIERRLSRLVSSAHPGKFYRKAPTCPVNPCSTDGQAVSIKTHMLCVYDGKDVNVPIYNISTPGQDTRAARAGREIVEGAKVKVDMLLGTYDMTPKNERAKFITDVAGNKLEVNNVGATLYLLSVTIISEPAA